MSLAAHPSAGHRAAAGLGVVFMLGSALLLTVNDTLAKWIMGGMPVSQFLVTRGLAILACLTLYLVARRQLHVLRIRNWRALLLRCSAMAGSSYIFLTALTLMPLADTFAIAFAAPLITLVLAVVFLKEQVGWRRWLAVAVGFGGGTIAMLPSGQGYSWTVALLPLASACCSALRDVSSRRLSATDATLGIMFYTVLALILSGAVGTLAEPWVAAPHDSIWLILLCGALQAIAHWMQIEAYRCAEVSLLMPFRYISLVFATALGFAVFGDVPTWNVAVGSCVIIGSGLFIWHRERQVRRRAAAAAT